MNQPPNKKIIITIPNSNTTAALQEQIVFVLREYGYLDHDSPILLSIDTWSNTYSIVLHNPIKGKE